MENNGKELTIVTVSYSYDSEVNDSNQEEI